MRQFWLATTLFAALSPMLAWAADPTPATSTQAPAAQAPAAQAPASQPAASPAPAAQAPAAQAPAAQVPAAVPAPQAPPKPDTVIARVNGEPIRFAEVQEAASQVPEEYRNLPPQILFPQIVEQLIDRRAILKLAQQRKLDQDPAMQKAMQRAADQALQNGLISREVGPTVTEQAVRARYDATIGSKPGEEEVHARHILVASEDEAKKIIQELGKGGDFAALAKAHSTDPGAAQGGDLGFFKRADMLPEFSAVAFALKPGEISQTPVKTRYGWHVIKLEEKRVAPPPSYEQSHDELRQGMIQEGIAKVVKEATAAVQVERFNPDGSPLKQAPSPAGAAAGAAPGAAPQPPAAPPAKTP